MVIEMKKVNILLSSYNGEKYIAEQLESLLEQDYDNFEIHIRDDGSTDGTVDVVKKYIEQFPDKVFLYEEQNVGYKKSFQWLMQHCGDADYFSFCDQDDHWYPNKVCRAVEFLEKYDNENPNIYLCDFCWCDGEMNRVHPNLGYKRYHSLEKYVTFGDRNAFGFTEVFNQRALQGIKDSPALADCSHDEVAYMYCLCKGNVVWDAEVCADFRRHGKNASQSDLIGGSKFGHFVWRVKTFLLESHKEETYARMQAFYDAFEQELDDYAKSVYELYLGNGKRCKKAFFRKRYRDTIIDEISIRILFLLGKI